MKTLAIFIVTGVVVCLFSIESQADGFVKAYQKEYAFLDAEKQALQKRLSEFDNRGQQRENAAKEELRTLQQQLLALHNRGDRIEMDLDETDRDNATFQERQDMLMETMSRARETLEGYGFELSAPAENPDVQATQINNIIKNAVSAFAVGTTVRVQDGQFFLPGGKKVNGKIVHVGNIAAYGVSDEGSGVLAPAGGQRYKLWDTTTADTAKALLAGQRPSQIDIFLYESLEKPVDHKESKTWRQIVDSGGVIAWIIVVLGVVAISLVLVRMVILARAGMRTDKLIKKVAAMVDAGDMDAARQKCSRIKGAAANVLKVTIDNLHKEREKLDDIVSEAILNNAAHIDRFNTAIMVAASVAPLLGLLGTVTGMISTFDIITEHGTGDPKMLSGGISEALVTTELGLIVAIPTLLFGTLLNGRASAIMDSMERAALHIINKDDVRKARRSSMPPQAPLSTSQDEAQETAATTGDMSEVPV